MESISAYSPAAISCIFRVWENENLAKMGSTGVGFTVDQGVMVRVSKSDKTQILFNTHPINLPTVQTVIKALTQKSIKVEITTIFPLGAGFGISGASSLATAYGLNQLLNIKKTKEELALICHKAEIVNKTGLGTVGTLVTGGFLLKTQPGLPVHARKLPFVGEKIYSVVFDSFTTNSVLTDKKLISRINRSADKALLHIFNFPNIPLSEMIMISNKFIRESGLVHNDKVREALENSERKGGHASMHILGHAIYSDSIRGLENYKDIFKLKISNDTVRLL